MRKHLGMFWPSEQFAPYFAVLKKAFLPKGEEQCGLSLATGLDINLGTKETQESVLSRGNHNQFSL